MNDRDWLTEALAEQEARLRHLDCEMIEIFSIVDQYGQRQPAIFVWRKEGETDQDPDAAYWLK